LFAGLVEARRDVALKAVTECGMNFDGVAHKIVPEGGGITSSDSTSRNKASVGGDIGLRIREN
jgi:hypothetical protein